MSQTLATPISTTRTIDPTRAWALLPALAAIGYPFTLAALFNAAGGAGATGAVWPPAVVPILAATFAAPVIGTLIAWKANVSPGVRRLAYASVAAPPLYVFLGVYATLFHSPVPDVWIWSAIWIVAATAAVASPRRAEPSPAVAGTLGGWRFAHGIGAAVVLVFVLFHLANHLFGLAGAETHETVADAGRIVYRAPVVEQLLLATFVFLAITGARLTWRLSAGRADFHRTFQIASGAYLLGFLLSHLNAFGLAHLYRGIATDWVWAGGAAPGLVHDAWSVRLLPYYILSVFLVLTHLASGLRAVLLEHGVSRTLLDRAWLAGAVLSAIVAMAIGHAMAVV